MNGNSRNRVLNDLKDKEARDAYVEGHARAGISYQIKAMRDSRKWSQEDLGREMGDKPQSTIARLENPDYGRLSVSTLLEIASAFDVALLVRFVAFGEILDRLQNMSLDELSPPNYKKDQGLKPSARVAS